MASAALASPSTRRWNPLFGKEVEPHAAAHPAAFLRCEAEELRRAAPTLAAPLVRGLDEIARLQRTAEAGLVEAPAEHELVDALQVAQGEGCRQQAKGER